MKLALPLALLVLSYPAQGGDLLADRADHRTRLVRELRDDSRPAEPEVEGLSLVEYPGPLGPMTATLARPETSAERGPAIVWIVGGFPPGGGGRTVWEAGDSENDQSAVQYREAGVVTLYPALRGYAGNPGVQESFYGEVDDVLAAIAWLREQPFVDPDRVYLGGHSTGGTLALLVAAATDELAGVFAFGPVARPSGYGEDALTYDPDDEREDALRSPVHYLDAITAPTFVIEGGDGNLWSAAELRKASSNDRIVFSLPIVAGHFDTLFPANRVIARAIRDTPAGEPLALAQARLTFAIERQVRANREAEDLETLADLARRGVDLHDEQRVRYRLLGESRDVVDEVAEMAAAQDFELAEVVDEDGWVLLTLETDVKLYRMGKVFEASAFVRGLAEVHELDYLGWTVE